TTVIVVVPTGCSTWVTGLTSVASRYSQVPVAAPTTMPEQSQFAPDIDTRLRPVGSVSVTLAGTAEGPAFSIVNVYVTFVPASQGAAATVFTIVIVASVAVVVIESSSSFGFGSGSGSL